jgi:hypothetical protein
MDSCALLLLLLVLLFVVLFLFGEQETETLAHLWIVSTDGRNRWAAMAKNLSGTRVN